MCRQPAVSRTALASRDRSWDTASSDSLDRSCSAIIGLLPSTPPIFNDYLGSQGYLCCSSKSFCERPSLPLKERRGEKKKKLSCPQYSRQQKPPKGGHSGLPLGCGRLTSAGLQRLKIGKKMPHSAMGTRVGPLLLEDFLLVTDKGTQERAPTPCLPRLCPSQEAKAFGPKSLFPSF